MDFITGYVDTEFVVWSITYRAKIGAPVGLTNEECAFLLHPGPRYYQNV